MILRIIIVIFVVNMTMIVLVEAWFISPILLLQSRPPIVLRIRRPLQHHHYQQQRQRQYLQPRSSVRRSYSEFTTHHNAFTSDDNNNTNDNTNHHHCEDNSNATVNPIPTINTDTLPPTEEISLVTTSAAAATTIATILSISEEDIVTVVTLPPQATTGTDNDNTNQKNSSYTSTTTATTTNTVVPSYRTILIFSMTTVLIWLSEPLLSLVDTTIVGQFAASRPGTISSTGSSTISTGSLRTATLTTAAAAAVTQLASLGPATTYIDSLFYTTYFLSIATTNIIARNLAVRNYQQLYRTVSHVITVATLLGVFCTVFTLVIGVPFVLPSMVGPSVTSGIGAAAVASSSSSSSSLLFFARRYVYIRASVAIASIISVTSQSILLATKDTRTPAIAVIATSITNIVGDILLRYYGVQGAATATALATIVSCTILLHAVYIQYQAWKQQHEKNNMFPNRIETAASSNSPRHLRSALPIKLKTIVRKVLQPGKSVISMFSLPDKEATLHLVTLAGPIFFVIVAKVVCYGAMTVTCTNFGVEALATHSIMMRLFFFFACFGDSLSQTAQSFLPAVLVQTTKTFNTTKKPYHLEPINGNDTNTVSSTPNENLKAPSDLTRMIRRLLTVGVWIGILNSQASTFIVRRCGHFVTNDVAITSLMKHHSHYMGLSLLVHPFIMLLEGIVLANRDYRTLIFTYATTMAMHFTILSNFAHSFPAVWRTFFLFQCTRLSLYAFRVWKWWWSARSIPSTSSKSR